MQPQVNHSEIFILYLRKSREDVEREKQTGENILQAHRDRLTELADNKGYKYIERAEVESGDTIAGRPVFKAVLEKEIPTGKYKGFIVNEVSRLGRGDMEDAGRIYKTIIRHNLYIITPFKTYDPTNRADLRQLRFELFLSREEFELIKERLMDGRDRRARQGYASGYLATLGIESVRGKIIVIPEEAALVREIYEMRAAGKGYGEIASILNGRGLKTKRGTRYHHSTIRRIVHNKRYIGKSLWQGEWYDCKMPPIVPVELWNMVNYEVNPARTVVKRTSPEDSPYWVNLYCHECSNRMYGEWVTIDRLMRSGCRKTYNDYGIYICHGRKKPVKCRHQQRTKYIHKKVLGELKKLINNTKTIQRLCNEKEEFSRSRENEIAQKITAINNKLKDVDKFLLRLDDDYKAGNLSAPLYSKHYEESIREKELLDAELVKAKNSHLKSKEAAPDIEEIISKARIVLDRWEGLSTPERKIVVRSFFPRIEVDKQGTLYIKKSIPFNLNFVSGIWSDN